MWHMTHISALSATNHARAAGAAVGDSLRPRRPGPWRSFDTYKCPKRDETERRRLAMQSVATNCTLKRIECLYLCRSVATDSAGCSATLISTRKGRGCGVPARWLHCCGVPARWIHCCGVPARWIHCCGVIARCAGLERAEAPCQRAGRVKAPREREERRGEGNGATGGAARRGERRSGRGGAARHGTARGTARESRFDAYGPSKHADFR